MSAATSFRFDTFDSQRSGEPTVVEVLGRTHSRLVDWVDFDNPKLGAGLAASWEQPDQRTTVLHLDQAARWHNAPPLHGRRLVAEDVAQHLDRAVALGKGKLPLAQRAGDYRNWSRVRTPDPETVVIETSTNDPFVLQTLAGRFALVQAPQAVSAFEASWHEASPETAVGTGPFRFQGRRRDGALTFVASRRGHVEAPLDAMDVFEPGSPEDLLSFRRDEALFRDRRDTAALRGEPRLRETPRYEDSPVISSLFVGSPPWNHPGLVSALSTALNRGWLSAALFGGRADPCGPVSPASGASALTLRTLAGFPGFGADADAEARTARALWEASGGPGLGIVTVDFPAVFDPLYSASSTVVGRLNDVLGRQFRAAVETYPTISEKAAQRRYGDGRAAFWFGWGPPLLEPDPVRGLLETYSSAGPNAALLGIQPSPVDSALGRLGDPSSPSTRQDRLHAAQQAILEAGGLGIITWLLQRSERFHWPYWHGSPPTPFWNQHLDHLSYLDPAGGGYSSRPS